MSFLAALLFTIAAAAPPHHAPAKLPKVGQLAPAFTLRDQNRRPVTLAAGTKVVLVFYRGYW